MSEAAEQPPVTLRLIEIQQDGTPAEDVSQTDEMREVCEAMAKLYAAVGYQPPWTGYLAQHAGEGTQEVVGTCGFKGPPQAGQVEIAYYTFAEFVNHGIATQMARQLIQISRESNRDVEVLAHTLSDSGASASILKKLGFDCLGTVEDPEDGEVFRWRLSHDGHDS